MTQRNRTKSTETSPTKPNKGFASHSITTRAKLIISECSIVLITTN